MLSLRWTKLSRLAAAAVVGALFLVELPARTWTSSDGTKTFEGELKSYDEATGTVVVTMAGGKLVKFPQDKLSAEDIAFVKENAKAAKPAAGGKPGVRVVKSGMDESKLLERPDGKEADMSKPVQVFILLGQSNMVGLGKISILEEAVKSKSKYPYLVDEAGAWIQRKDVRNVFVMASGNSPAKEQHNDWLSVSNRKNLGPELGIGHCLGNAVESPVMLLKSCIGNRSLGWDLLPPGSEPYEFEGKPVPGYRGTPKDPKGNGEPVTGEWYAGCQYDGDIAAAKKALSELNKYYPGGKGYEVGGFFFWQGEKDGGNAAHAAKYEENLVRFIKSLRKDFESPNAKFVLATLGEAKKGSGGNGGKVLEGHLNVDGESGKYPEFKGNVATVYANPLSLGGSGNGHYGGNAETYMNVGEAMGKAMVKLLQ